jgi:predicted transcriptional regulator with HTH domain
VQDKLRACIAALARNAALASVTRNNSTRVVLRELLNASADRKSLLSAIARDCKMTANTASSQVSSSLIALSHLAIIEQDAGTKAYRVSDAQRETASALAA